MKLPLLCAAALFLAAPAANAALVAYITGTPGSGFTTWSFSGSTAAGVSGFFQDGDSLNFNDAWQDIGEFTDLNDFENFAVAGTAEIMIGSASRAMDLAYIDSDSGTSADDWGVGVIGSTDFEFEPGDIVSWSGFLSVTGIDVNDLNNSGLPITFITSNYDDIPGNLDLELTIEAIAPIPIGPTLPLMAAGIGCLGLVRRMRRQA